MRYFRIILTKFENTKEYFWFIKLTQKWNGNIIFIFVETGNHSWSITKPTLVGISKATLDKSLGLAQFKWDFKNKVYTKRFNMHIIIIPEQIVKNPNFKPILVVKE